MPRIPLYNQGLGPSVQMPTGQLSPRASAQALAAPGQAMAGLGRVIQQTAQVGAKFEMERQQREAEDLQLIMDRKLSEQASDLNRDGTLRDVDSYRSAFDGLQTKLFSDVDAMERLNAGQKRAIKRGLNAKGNVLRAAGAEQAHGFYLQDATANFNEYTLASLSDQRGAGFGYQEATTNILIEDYEQRHKKAVQAGLKPALSPQEYTFEVFKDQVSAASMDRGNTLTDLEQLRLEIMNADGRFNQIDLSGRNALANLLDKRIKFLTNEGVSEARANFVDANASLVNAKTAEEREKHVVAAQDSIAYLAAYGQADMAAKLDMELSGTFAALDAADALVFADLNARTDALENARLRTQEAAGTDRAAEVAYEEMKTREALAAQQQAKQEDLAEYVRSNYFRINGVEPSQAQVLDKQRLMGIPENQRKALTKNQVNSVIDRVNQAQNATEVSVILSSVAESDTLTPVVMRQLIGSGLSLAANYAANLPTSPSSSMLLNSARPDAMKVTVSAAMRDRVRSLVIRNDVVDKHLKSSLGAFYTDFNNNDIVGSASDNPAMNQSRAAHVDMLVNLSLYMMQEKGEALSGDDKISISGIEDYVEQAATVLSERYDYIESFENRQTALRIPAYLAPQKKQISKSLARIVENTLERDIFYNNPVYDENDPRQALEKTDYVNRIKDGYGWIAHQDGKSAFLVDDTGGLVFRSALVAGVVQIVPFRVTFDEAFKEYEKMREEQKAAWKQAEPYLGMIGG